MKVTRFVATPDGGSRFEEIDIPITNLRQEVNSHTLRLSIGYTSPRRVLRRPAGKSEPELALGADAPDRRRVVGYGGSHHDRQRNASLSAGEALIAAAVSGRLT